MDTRRIPGAVRATLTATLGTTLSAMLGTTVPATVLAMTAAVGGFLLPGTASASPALPLLFESAAPAAGEPSAFVARAPGHALLVGATSSQLLLDGASPVTVRSTLVGASASAPLRGEDALRGGVSRFHGADPSKWVKRGAAFRRVRADGVYPGVDMVWHGRAGTLEYDFEVEPGADPSRIELRVEGARIVAIDDGGDLVLDAGGRSLRWKKPVSWQHVDGRRVDVASRFVRRGDDRVGFELGAFDASRPVTIDPVLAYSTYVAGTTFTTGDGLQNHGLAVVVDDDGNAYVTGVVQSASFPVTGGAFDTTRPGNSDAFVAKLLPDGSDLEWATYLGGTGVECYDNRYAGIAIDAAGAVYVTGSTKSADFPTTGGAWDTTLGGTTDVFVAKLSADGSSLEWSTYLGGDGIERGTGIVLDSAGRPVVVGDTNDDFPTTPGAFQTLSDNLSAFATKLEADGSALVWSTVLGRNSGAARDVAIDKDDNLYVTGLASPPGGPDTGYPVTGGAFQTTVSGSFDAFVTKLAADGASLVWSTYLGGSGNEEGMGVEVRSDGTVYVLGGTTSTNFPTTDGAFQKTLQSTPTPLADAFVAKLTASGASLAFSTYLGGASLEDPIDLVVDAAGNAIVTGATYSGNFPTTAGALQADMNPGPSFISAFVSKVSTTGGLSYSTLLHPEFAGGTSFGYGLALDGKGAALLTGTASYEFPTTTGAFQETITLGRAGPFVAKIDDIADAGSAVVCGDANGDGQILTADALIALKTAVGNGSCGLAACDFNGDGSVLTSDALLILRVAVGQTVTAKCPAS